MALTFALIAPVQSVLYRVYCRNETIPNAPKHYETRQNMSLRSYGLVWVRSLRKIPTRLRRTNFWTKCTSSARFAPSFTAVIKQSQMHLNTMKRAEHELRVPWVQSGALTAKNSTQLRAPNFCINCTSLGYFAPSFMQ